MNSRSGKATYRADLVFSGEDHYFVNVAVNGFENEREAKKFANSMSLFFDKKDNKLYLLPDHGYKRDQLLLTDNMVQVQRVNAAAREKLARNGSPIDPAAPGAVQRIIDSLDDGTLVIEENDMENCPIKIEQFHGIPGLCDGFESIAYGVSACCRICGCTDLDCSGCIERTGSPCHWVAPGLCSACA